MCSLKDRVGNQLGAAARVGGVRKALLRCKTPNFLYKCELMSRYEKEALGVPGRRRGECLSSDSVRLNLVMMQDRVRHQERKLGREAGARSWEGSHATLWRLSCKKELENYWWA